MEFPFLKWKSAERLIECNRWTQALASSESQIAVFDFTCEMGEKRCVHTGWTLI